MPRHNGAFASLLCGRWRAVRVPGEIRGSSDWIRDSSPHDRRASGTECHIRSKKKRVRGGHARCTAFGTEHFQTEDSSMNWDTIEGKWRDLKGQVKSRWGKL